MKSSKKHSGWKKHSKSAPIPCAGDKVDFTAASAIPDGSYVTFVSGLSVVSVKGESKGKSAFVTYKTEVETDKTPGNSTTAVIPQVAEGQTYVFVSKKDVEGKLDDSAILFGPAILEVAPQPPTYDPNQQ